MGCYMRLVVLLAIASLVFAQGQGKSKPTAKQLATIKGLLSTMFNDDETKISKAVRLSFHDCCGVRCDGCLNLNNENNYGLGNIVKALQNLSTNTAISPFLSNADLWSLAGIVAVEDGVKISNEYCTNSGCKKMPALTTAFKWGREDCDDSPTTAEIHDFPFAEMNRQQMMDFFNDSFGFNEAEVTALMGAHTLGGASIENSGYEGAWTVGKEYHFNTQFYAFLRGSRYFRNDANDPEDSNKDGNKKFQFNLFKGTETKRSAMMLNVDVELAYDIDVNATLGTQCQVGDNVPPTPGPEKDQVVAGKAATKCPEAPTVGLVDTYKEDRAAFMRDFSAVFEKMMDKGNPDLETIGCMK